MKETNIFRGWDLRTERIVIPANGTAVVDVVASFYYKSADGYVAADFAMGDFKASTPGVLITVLPPGS